MSDDLRPPYRIAFDNARDPYTARNALGIAGTGAGLITSATPPLSITSGVISIDLTGYQPLDADLTSLAAASATNAIYYRSAANTWAPVAVGTGLSFTGGTLAGGPQLGRTDASNPAAGYVGEYLEAGPYTVGAAMGPGVWANALSLSLPAGDWDVWANVGIFPASGSVFCYVGLATYAAAPDTTWLSTTTTSAGGDAYIAVAAKRINFSGANITIYLVTNIGAGSYGLNNAVIRARRRS